MMRLEFWATDRTETRVKILMTAETRILIFELPDIFEKMKALESTFSPLLVYR